MHNNIIFAIFRRNISIAFMALAIIGFTSLMGLIFFVRGRSLMELQLHERLKSVVVSSALLLREVPLGELQTEADINKPSYALAIQKLNIIRAQNAGVRFAYVLRPTVEPTIFTFVADADSLYPFDPFDLNSDSKIDDADTLAPPGTPYDVSDIANIHTALRQVVITDEPYTDQWGTYMSAFAPVRGTNGDILGVLGIDMDISQYRKLSQSIFSPIAYLLFFLAASLLTGYIFLFVKSRKTEALRALEADRLSLMQTASHQLGTPVTLLHWAMEEIKEVVGPKAEEKPLSDHFKDMDSSIAWIEGILHSLYQADKIHRNTMRQNPQIVPLKEMMNRVFEEIRLYAKRKNISLALVMDGEWSVKMDPALLQSVIRELLSNAIDYSPNDSSISLNVRKIAKMVEVSVQDQGCGIPQDELDQMFHKFSRATNAKLVKPNGSGLGLYIAHGAIEQAGGNMWLESAVNRGTTVSFRLPIA